MPRTVSSSARTPRDPKFKPIDASALYAVAQAAVNVELFTIPLYMGTLYSIQGMHKIAAKGESFFKGRLWPGRSHLRQSVDRERAGVQHHLLGLHPGDAPPPACRQYRRRDRGRSELHQPHAAK